MDCTNYSFLRKKRGFLTLLVLAVLCLLAASFFFFTSLKVDAKEQTETTSSPELRQASVSLKDDIILHYYLYLPNSIVSPSITFTLNNKSSVVSTFLIDESTGLYKFSFYGITPQLIFSKVSSVLNYIEANEEKSLELQSYSISEYCEKLLSIDTYDGLSSKKMYSLKSLAVDILKYGEAASAVVSTDEAAQLSLSADALSLSNVHNDNDSIPLTKTVEDTTDTRVTWIAAGVNFSSCISVYFKAKVKTADIPSLEFSILHPLSNNFVKTNNYDVTAQDNEYSIVKFYSNGVSPKFFTKPLQAQIFLKDTDNEKYGGYCEYSVSSCINNNFSDTQYSNFVKTVFAYGKSAVLYENIDEMTFTSSGNIESNDYVITATKDNYSYSITYPSIYTDNYEFEKLENGKCKFTLKSGYIFDGFGSVQSNETDIPTFIKIGNKLYTNDFSSLLDNITASENDGTLNITLNNYISTESLAVCAKTGVNITLTGTNQICYETSQKAIYSPVNVDFSGDGTLSCGVVEVDKLTTGTTCLLQISTGNTTGSGYALKTSLGESCNIDITTKLDYGFQMMEASVITSGNLTITGADTGIKGTSSIQFAGSQVKVSIQSPNVGIDTDRVQVSSSAEVTISAKSTGIKATTITTNGILTITDTTKSAIILDCTTDTINLRNGTITIVGNNSKAAAIDMSMFSGELVLKNIAISITGYKYGFYTTNNATYTYDTQLYCTLNEEEMSTIPSLAFKGFSI